MAKTAIVTGATGQDGYFLVRRLLGDGWTVYAAARDPAAATTLFEGHERLLAVARRSRPTRGAAALVGDVQPDELYNLAGESSVYSSFDDPRATWETNAHVVVHLLDAVRKTSPETRVYQASSGEMFGSTAGGEVVHDEESALNPQSPYAAAKAAAHMLCRSYRESYGVRIACGILFNHESHRRGPRFLTRKVVDHLRTRSSRAATRRQPEGAARLGLRPGLRRGDATDPAPDRRARRRRRRVRVPGLRPRNRAAARGLATDRHGVQARGPRARRGSSRVRILSPGVRPSPIPARPR